MFAVTPIVILLLALTAGGTATIAEQQADKAEARQAAAVESAEGHREVRTAELAVEPEAHSEDADAPRA